MWIMVVSFTWEVLVLFSCINIIWLLNIYLVCIQIKPDLSIVPPTQSGCIAPLSRTTIRGWF